MSRYNGNSGEKPPPLQGNSTFVFFWRVSSRVAEKLGITVPRDSCCLNITTTCCVTFVVVVVVVIIIMHLYRERAGTARYRAFFTNVYKGEHEASLSIKYLSNIEVFIKFALIKKRKKKSSSVI